LIPGARLIEIEAAAHLANLENPEAFNEAVAGFLKG
jgi:pimeloyl-ACP methyl ester carboxylesterase